MFGPKAVISEEKQREAIRSNEGWVEGEVYIDFERIIGMDLEQFLDYISNLLVGHDLLMDVDYEAKRVEDGALVLLVGGVVPEDWFDDEEE